MCSEWREALAGVTTLMYKQQKEIERDIDDSWKVVVHGAMGDGLSLGKFCLLLFS